MVAYGYDKEDVGGARLQIWCGVRGGGAAGVGDQYAGLGLDGGHPIQYLVSGYGVVAGVVPGQRDRVYGGGGREVCGGGRWLNGRYAAKNRNGIALRCRNVDCRHVAHGAGLNVKLQGGKGCGRPELGSGERYCESRVIGRGIQRGASQSRPISLAGPSTDEYAVEPYVVGRGHVYRFVERQGQDSGPHIQDGVHKYRWSTVSGSKAKSNDMHCSPVNAARLHAAINAGYKVGYAVAVKVAHGCHGFAKVVIVGQDGTVWRGAVDLRGALYSAVGVHQHDVHGAPAVVARNTLAVVAIGAGCQVGHAVAVKVAHGCHGRTKVIMVGQDGAVWRGVVDLRGALYSAVGVHQHDVHGAPVGAPPVVEIAPYCQI